MDYASLQTAIGDWTTRTDVAAYYPSFIEMAEAMLNHGTQQQQALRVREMAAVVDIPISSGAYPLPADYLQYRRVVEKASLRRPLEYITPEASDQSYPDRGAGIGRDFTIIGSNLYAFPSSGNDIELTYYRAIPALSASTPTNWLLQKQPNLYLHASIMQLAMFVRDAEMLAQSSAMVQVTLDGLNSTDLLANFAKVGTRMGGICP